MTDREQVIAELEYMKRDVLEDSDKDITLNKAIALLKEQEAVEPTVDGIEEYDGHSSWWYQCGKCKTPIDHGDRFCRWCGMRVKWG